MGPSLESSWAAGAFRPPLNHRDSRRVANREPNTGKLSRSGR